MKKSKERMMKSSTKDSSVPQLSAVRTFLFWALAVVWFTEMVFLGFPSLSGVWTDLWRVVPPQNPQLVTALAMVWAVAAPAKGALFMTAVFALRSRDASLRTALFVPMALIPPLNLLFPFRQQGFLLELVLVATVLSLILWGTFFLFRESIQQPEQKGTRATDALPPSWWEIFQHVWLVVYATSLTLIAFLLLLWRGSALKFVVPCLSSVMKTNAGELSGLIHSAMASGTHLLALAIACWIATASYRSSPALRKAMAAASTVHAGLVLIFPLRQIVLGFGAGCATSSILAVFVPMLVGWVLCMASGYKAKPQTRQEAYI
jgi:hypothetical protein